MMKVKKQRLLIVRPDAIGDVLLMIPMVNKIKALYPNIEIYTLQQSYTKPLLINHPDVTDVLVDWRKSGKCQSFSDFIEYVRYIKLFKFDTVIFSYLDLFYVLLAYFAGIPHRIGDSNKIFLRFFLTEPVSQPFRNLMLHEVEQNMVLLKGLSGKRESVGKMNVYMEEATLQRAKKCLINSGWKNEILIGIHPSTGGGNRAWLPKYYVKLINSIHQKTSCRVVLTGFGEKEFSVNQYILAVSEKTPINLTNKTDLELLKGICSHCCLFIGTDTGPTHLAAALNIPVVSVSPTKFVKSLRWGPWGTLNRIASNSRDCSYICDPYHCRQNDCLDLLTPEMVFNKVDDLLLQLKSKSNTGHFIVDKLDWFVHSVNVMFMISSDQEPYFTLVERYIKELEKKKVSFFLVCQSSRIRDKLCSVIGDYNVFVISSFHIVALLRFISTHDITVIHHIPKLNFWYWNGFIRQLSALRLYCPPVIIQQNNTKLVSDDLVSYYMEAFQT